jgi:hypothetical protein
MIRIFTVIRLCESLFTPLKLLAWNLRTDLKQLCCVWTEAVVVLFWSQRESISLAFHSYAQGSVRSTEATIYTQLKLLHIRSTRYHALSFLTPCATTKAALRLQIYAQSQISSTQAPSTFPFLMRPCKHQKRSR